VCVVLLLLEARSRYTGTITNVSLTRYRGQSQKKTYGKSGASEGGKKKYLGI